MFLKNHKMDEAVAFHTCSWHYPLHELCFLFDQVRTLAAIATFLSLWLYLKIVMWAFIAYLDKKMSICTQVISFEIEYELTFKTI